MKKVKVVFRIESKTCMFRAWFLSPPQCKNLERLRARVTGKTVLITGASFGIGEAAARLLAEAGAKVLLIARTKEKLEQLQTQIIEQGGNASIYLYDLYDRENIHTLATTIKNNHPHLDIVICNAGKSIRRSILEAKERCDLERSLALNFTNHSALVLELLPGLIARGGGQIINVSSIGVRLPPAPHWAAYQSSKAGFDLWLRSLANELRHQKIRVSSVYFPLVRTRMIEPTRHYDKMSALSPHEAAQVIAHAIITRRDRLAPPWLPWTELLSLGLRTPLDLILGYVARRTPL
ncbi:MAG: SDR family NAD(P)-dependent oxidoreductase [Trueperaceae bacterium]